MKLDKTAYFFTTKQVEVGKDIFGRPEYETQTVPDIPFQMEWEPYSPDRAKQDYAINVVEVEFLMYVYPDERMKRNTDFLYGTRKYKITYVLPYDNHYEVFIKDVGKYPEEDQY